jgi:glycosyltransferase involved in cell wall biosynthesis
MTSDAKIAIAWNGLPFYAACLIRAGIEKLGEPVCVIGSKPTVPIEGMEKVLGQPIHWIDSDRTCSWSLLNVATPDIFIHTGWKHVAFNDLEREVRQRGGQIVSMIDNCYKNSPKQWVGAIVFRSIYRHWFDAVWVPGLSGEKLCRFLGMPQDKIYQGLYGADSNVFSTGIPLSKREKKFIFVGQFIKRKGIDLLVQAFHKFHLKFPDWQLHVIGSGDLSSLIQGSGIFKEEFKQPNEVAQLMKQSRFLILPSHEEHWGLVIHEATLSGCGIITSNTVGSALDLVSSKNGVIFQTHSVGAIYKAMVQAAKLSNTELDQVFSESCNLASKFGPKQFALSLNTMINELRLQKKY